MSKYGFKKGSPQAATMSRVELDFAKELLQKNCVNLADFPVCVTAATQKQEDKNPMSNEQRYLLEVLDENYWAKRRELEKQFNLHVDTMPRTYKELIDWVKTEKYTLDTKRTKLIDDYIDTNPNYRCNAYDGITWTGRTGPDYDGYEAALKELEAKKTKIRSRIVIVGGETALAEVEALEAWTPTVGNS